MQYQTNKIKIDPITHPLENLEVIKCLNMKNKTLISEKNSIRKYCDSVENYLTTHIAQ